MTWNSWIVSIEIVRKCLFNTRFSFFYFHLCLLRNSKVLFARAQRGEMLIFVFLILTLWFWLDFGVRCVGISTLQWVRKFKKRCPFCLHSHAYITPCPFRVPLVCPRSGMRNVTNLCVLACGLEYMDAFIKIECKCFTHCFLVFPPLLIAQKLKSLVCRTSARRIADFRFLDTDSLILIGFWIALRWYFYASVGEKITKEMSLLSALTCVHHPMSLSRTSAHREWFDYFLAYSWCISDL